MTLHEAITEEINREFTDSLGNWTGDAIWQPSVPQFASGVASLILMELEGTKTMTLAYPFVKPGKGAIHRLFGQAAVSVGPRTITLRVSLTDGIHTLTDQVDVPPGMTPTDIDFNLNVPGNFNRTTTQLSLTAHEDSPEDDDALSINSISLTYETKIDYLPVVGVG